MMNYNRALRVLNFLDRAGNSVARHYRLSLLEAETDEERQRVLDDISEFVNGFESDRRYKPRMEYK